jgi:hypothetical protein
VEISIGLCCWQEERANHTDDVGITTSHLLWVKDCKLSAKVVPGDSEITEGDSKGICWHISNFCYLWFIIIFYIPFVCLILLFTRIYVSAYSIFCCIFISVRGWYLAPCLLQCPNPSGPLHNITIYHSGDQIFDQLSTS